MSKGFNTLSNGEFTFAETDVKNQFYFYRNDGEVLGEVDRLPMDFYQQYIMKKMMDGEITEMVMNNILFETSDDGKCIRLTVSDIGETPKAEEKPKTKKSNFFKRIFKKIFG